jgi:hypothetical protein
MLEIRRANKEELQNKLNLNNFNLHNTLFILENGNILGWGSYELFDNYGKLKKIHIENGYEILKDGLLRSLLNMMDYFNVNYFVMKNDSDEKLYCRIGFKKLEEYSKFGLDKDNYLYIDIKKFFNSSCQCNYGE